MIISFSTILNAMFFIMTFNNGLAIYHGDTTLAWWYFRSLIIGVGYACTVICAVLVFIQPKRQTTGFTRNDLMAFFIPFIYFVVVLLSDGDGTLSFFLLLLLRSLGLGLFIVVSRECKLKVFEMYRRALILMALAGIIIYAAHTVGIPLPHRVVPYYSVVGAGNYHDYYVGYIYSTRTGITRLCGLFNEPGYLGTIIAFVLCADGMNLKKVENIILFVAGCLTFSFAFFAMVIIYLIMASYKKPKIMAVLIVLLLLMIFVVPNIQFVNSNESISKLISRFYTLETSLASRTRSTFDALFERWKASDKILFGYGHGYGKALDPDGSSSYKSYFVDYGVIGFFLLFVPLLVYAFRKARGDIRKMFYVVVFVASIYQRPNIYTILYFTILFGGLEYISSKSSKKQHI